MHAGVAGPGDVVTCAYAAVVAAVCEGAFRLGWAPASVQMDESALVVGSGAGVEALRECIQLPRERSYHHHHHHH